MAGDDDPRGLSRADLYALTCAAYDRRLEYILRSQPAWWAFMGATSPPPLTRWTRARRAARRKIDNFRYRLAKRIYDFPEESW